MSSALLEMPTTESPTQNPPIQMPTASPTRSVRAHIHRIVLAGFMGSGKTSVGRRLAAALGWEFADLDREIERRAGLTVPEIFASGGEAHFRRLESAALAGLLGRRRLVLALGGGAPEQLGNRLLLEQTPHTAVVHLTAPLDTLIARCQRDAADPSATERPLLTEAADRFHHRRPLYEQIAGHTLDTAALDLDQATAAVLEALGG